MVKQFQDSNCFNTLQFRTHKKKKAKLDYLKQYIKQCKY